MHLLVARTRPLLLGHLELNDRHAPPLLQLRRGARRRTHHLTPGFLFLGEHLELSQAAMALAFGGVDCQQPAACALALGMRQILRLHFAEQTADRLPPCAQGGRRVKAVRG